MYCSPTQKTNGDFNKSIDNKRSSLLLFVGKKFLFRKDDVDVGDIG